MTALDGWVWLAGLAVAGLVGAVVVGAHVAGLAEGWRDGYAAGWLAARDQADSDPPTP